MLSTRAILCCLVLATAFTATMRADGPGILLLAHGGSAEWNAHVTTLAGQVNQTKPTEVAFGMATRASLQAAVDRLRARGVTDIVAVPLFVSSWSSVITSTEYLLGQRAVAPPELDIYAKMSHTPAGALRRRCAPTRGACGRSSRRGEGARHRFRAHPHDLRPQRSPGRGRHSRQPGALDQPQSRPARP